MSQKINRRKFLQMSAMTATGVALAACAAPAAQAPAPTAPAAEQKPAEAAAAPTTAPAAGAAGTVVFWVDWTDIEPAFKTFQGMQEFKDTLGGATLEYKVGGDMNTQLLTAVAAGTPPDSAANIDYVQYMNKGQFQDIGDMVKSSTIIKPENFIEGAWHNGSWKGVQYGVPAIEHFLNYGLNYNADLVEKAGLDPNQPPETWSEALEWHKQLTQFDDAGNVKVIGLDPYDAMASELDFAGLSFGFQPFNEDTGKHDFNNPGMVEALKTMGEFYKVVGPDKMVAMRGVEGQGGWGTSFNAGVQAAIIEGYWHPGETVIQKPDVAKFNRASWAPVSDSRKGKKIQGVGGHFVPVLVGAKNPQGAFKLAEWFVQDQAIDILFKQVGWLPPLKAYIAKVNPDAYPGLKFYIDSVNEATDWTPNFRRSPIKAFNESQYQELREAVYRDKMSAEDAAAELQKRADAEWKNQGY